jgi:hypothetical protein
MNRLVVFIALLTLSVESLATTIAINSSEGSRWFFSDVRTTSNGLPSGGNCSYSDPGSGASVQDAWTAYQYDAFDLAAMYWVNDIQVGGLISAPTSSSVEYSPVSIADLNVQLKYELMTSSAMLRAFLTLENPTSADISVPVVYATNFGSDFVTSVKATSSGDEIFSTSDRWIVTNDAVIGPDEPVNTTVLFGPNLPVVTPSSVSQIVFDCGSTQGAQATFNLTVPAGEKVALMMFQQLNTLVHHALAAANEFDATPDSNSDLLAGLTDDDISIVVNWNFNKPPVADAGGPYLIAADLPIILDGTATDPNDDDLTYQWSVEAGYFDDESLEDPTYYGSSLPGIYELSFTATDSLGLSSAAVGTVVVYDPFGGYITGSGWIDSPAGAYKNDSSLTGKAKFGFVSKYKKGHNTPSGETEFQFSAGDLDFHSNNYQWLVVNQNGVNAQYKGDGTINGNLAPTGEAYRFMLWASDGDNVDTVVLDTFRIRIWYEDTNGVEVDVYDNGFNQAINGGSIVIHTGKGKK